MKDVDTGIRRKSDIFFSIFGLLIGLAVAFPIFFSIFSGFMPDAEKVAYPPRFFPSSFSYLENYRVVLFKKPIPRFMVNSLIVAIMGTVLRLIVSSLAAFSFAYLKCYGKKFFFFMLLGTMLMPGETIIIQNYLTARGLGLVNTYLGMCVLGILSAQHIFMLRQGFLGVSKFLREAAYIDGCSNFRYFLSIAMPVSKPILASISIASFVQYWNAYLWPLLVTTQEKMRPVQVGIVLLQYPEMTSNAGVLAGASIAIIPSIIIFIISQRSLVKGIAAGSVKG